MKNMYKIILKLCALHPADYNPTKVSIVLSNSLKNKKEWIKAHRLHWLSVSLREAKTQRTKSWNASVKRIVIGIDDKWVLYLLDWRHLLEAYTILHKNIPQNVLHFVTKTAKNVFTTTLKSLDS